MSEQNVKTQSNFEQVSLYAPVVLSTFVTSLAGPGIGIQGCRDNSRTIRP